MLKKIKIYLAASVLCALLVTFTACGENDEKAKETQLGTTAGNTEAEAQEETMVIFSDEAENETAKSDEEAQKEDEKTDEASSANAETIASDSKSVTYTHYDEEMDWIYFIVMDYNDNGTVQIAFDEQNSYALFPDASMEGFVDVYDFTFSEGSEIGESTTTRQVSVQLDGDTATLIFKSDTGEVGEPVIYTKAS